MVVGPRQRVWIELWQIGRRRSQQADHSLNLDGIGRDDRAADRQAEQFLNLGIGQADDFLAHLGPRVIWGELLRHLREEHMIGRLLEEVELLAGVGPEVEQHLVVEEVVLVGRVGRRPLIGVHLEVNPLDRLTVDHAGFQVAKGDVAGEEQPPAELPRLSHHEVDEVVKPAAVDRDHPAAGHREADLIALDLQVLIAVRAAVVEVEGVKAGVAEAVGRADDLDVPEDRVDGVVDPHAVGVAPQLQVFHDARLELQGCLRLLLFLDHDEGAVVVDLGPQLRAVGGVAAEGSQRGERDRHVVRPLRRRRIGQVGRGKGGDAQAILEEGLGVENQAAAGRPGDDVVFHPHAGALQPEAVAGMAKVAVDLPRLWLFPRAVHLDGEIADERADLVARLGVEGGPGHVVGDVVGEVDMA